jgi:two-component system, OmpR family, sensor histidine kinase ResE
LIRILSGFENEETLIVGVPIYNSNKVITGTVLLIAPVNGVTKALNKAIYILIIGLIIGLVIAIGLGLFYSLIFTNPLKRMNQIAIEMTNGNYLVKTGIDRKDELGQLGNSLDTLASKLNITISQLFQEKNKTEDIISSISEGIVAFDLDMNIINSNKSLAIIMNRQIPYLEDEIKKP